jgi:hypothetical protein
MDNCSSAIKPNPKKFFRLNEQYSMNNLNESGTLEEAGSVEAGLALIPTTIFFLLILQIVIAGSWQVLERSKVHDVAIRSMISPEQVDNLSPSDFVVDESKRSYGTLRTFYRSKKIPIIGGLLDMFSEDSARVRVTAVSVQ